MERPLTIACQIKKAYFFVESTFAFMLSLAALAVESITALLESAVAFTDSVPDLAAESVLLSELDALLQAANEPIANTTKSFFIVMLFCE
jgi:hypothetical protein